MSNLQSLYSPLIIQSQPQTDRSNTDTKHVVTERTQRTYSVQGDGNKLQYSIDKASYSGDLSGNKSFQSPYSWKLDDGSLGLDNKITKSVSQHISYNTTYGAQSISPVIGNQTYRTYRSPSEKVTSFDVHSIGYKDTLSQYNQTNKINEAKNLKQIDSTSQIQQQLYKNPQQTITYQYQNIINPLQNDQYGKQQNKNSSGAVRIQSGTNQRTYSGKLSPVMNLNDVNKANDYRSQFFHYYSGGNQTNTVPTSQQTNIVPVTKQQIYQSHTTSFVPHKHEVSNLNKYEVNTSTYKPLLASAQYNDRYTTIKQNQQTTITPPTYLSSNQQATYQHQQSHYIPQSSYQSFQSTQQNQYPLVNQSQGNKEKYSVIEEIQRPVYDKLYTNTQENKRLTVERDPPRSNAFCGLILWIPLLILGLALAILGMLCGLGVICPGGAVLKEAEDKGYIGMVEPTIEPVYIVPEQVQPEIQIVPIIPQNVQPQTPISVNPQQPIEVTPTIINKTTVQTNATVITPPIDNILQFQPQVITTNATTTWTASNIDYSASNNYANYTSVNPSDSTSTAIQPSTIQPIYKINTVNVSTVPETNISISPSTITPSISTTQYNISYQIPTDYSQPQAPSGYVTVNQQTVTHIEPQMHIQPQMHIEPQMHIQPTIQYTTTTSYNNVNSQVSPYTITPTMTANADSNNIDITPTTQPSYATYQPKTFTPSQPKYSQLPSAEPLQISTMTSPSIIPIQPSNVIVSPSSTSINPSSEQFSSTLLTSPQQPFQNPTISSQFTQPTFTQINDLQSIDPNADTIQPYSQDSNGVETIDPSIK